jgi:hypothetical protein
MYEYYMEETQSPLTLLCQWIITTLQHISQKATVKEFKKCCTSNAVDSMLWNDSSKGVGISSSERENDDHAVEQYKQ